MVRVVRIIVMVGVKAAVVAGPGVPGKLPVAPLNFHCPHEVMMRNKKKQTKNQKRGKSNWTAQIKSNNNNKKMKAACTKKRKKKNWLCPFLSGQQNLWLTPGMVTFHLPNNNACLSPAHFFLLLRWLLNQFLISPCASKQRLKRFFFKLKSQPHKIYGTRLVIRDLQILAS